MTAVAKTALAQVDIRSFGAVSGSTGVDSGAAMQSAIDSLGSAGGEIIIPKGTWYWNTVPKLPRSLTGWLRIIGTGGAIIKLTSGGPRAFDFDRTADYQTFQYLHLEGFDVDCNSVTGLSHVILGNYVADTTSQRLNFNQIVVRDVRAYNIPTNQTVASGNRIGICISSLHTASDESTQTVMTNLTFERVRIEGGNSGILVNGLDSSSGTSANVWIDNITIRDCYFSAASIPTAFYAASGYHVGQDGYGGSVTISGCVAKWAGDNGFEVNAMTDSLVEDCHAIDCYNVNFFAKNYRQPAVVASQRLTWRDCSSTFSGLTQVADLRAWDVGAGTYGCLLLDGCRAEILADASFDSGGSFLRIPSTATVSDITIRDMSFNQTVSASLPANQYPSVLYFVPTGECRVTIDGATVKTTGSVTLNGYTSTFRLANISGTNCTLFANNVLWVYSVTGTSATTTMGWNIGEESSSVVRGTIRRFRPVVSGDSSPKGVRIRGTGTLTLAESDSIRIEDCDFTDLGGGTEVYFDSAAQKPYVFMPNNRWITNPPANLTITPSGSPYTYQNVAGFPLLVTVQAGTVTKIEVSSDNSTFVDVGATAGAFPVSNGGSVRVTYSSAPTMKGIPLR